MKAWMAAALVALGALLAWGAISVMTPRQGAGTNEQAPAADESAVAADEHLAEGEIAMAPALQAKLGVTVTTLQPATAPAVTSGFARALDLAPLAAIEGDIAVARAAAAASAADAARLKALAAADQSASVRSVQAAVAQADADRARTDQARRRVALEFGPGLAAMGDAARARLLAEVAAGRAALLRIDIPGETPATGSRVRIGDGAAATVIGAAAAADARLQSAGALAVLRGAGVRQAGAGRLLSAAMASGGTAQGVIVPREAVLRWHGSLWVYALTSKDHFQRREIADPRPVDSGWFVMTGLAPGDRIVSGNAGALLAEERGGSGGEDE